jgi:hypothetical protein
MLRGRVRKMEEAQKREEGQRKEGAVWMEEGKEWKWFGALSFCPPPWFIRRVQCFC